MVLDLRLFWYVFVTFSFIVRYFEFFLSVVSGSKRAFGDKFTEQEFENRSQQVNLIELNFYAKLELWMKMILYAYCNSMSAI